MAEAKERAAVPESPRIAALRHSLAAGTEARATLTAFWDEVARSGTPLVEAIPGDDGHLLVTFLWRDAGPPEDTRNVVLFGGPAGWTVAHNHLLRLPGTDVWYRSYRVRADARLAYWLSPNDCLLETYQIDPYDAEAVEARLATAGLDPFNRRPYPAERPVYSTVELPGAPPEPFIGRRPWVARGTVQVSAFRSRLLGNERRVWRYTPPATAPGRGRPASSPGR
ncbi:MAG TPA: enterochelin esterase domain-containing protein, partial [Chloroflexota bacterium]|nr:enterochelin esterase domain-containing protein [Chloroflexota bacterium]